MSLNDRDRSEIRTLIYDARNRAMKYGTMHPLWDAIFDAEALLEGGPTLIPYRTRESIEELKRVLQPSNL